MLAFGKAQRMGLDLLELKHWSLFHAEERTHSEEELVPEHLYEIEWVLFESLHHKGQTNSTLFLGGSKVRLRIS